MAFFKRPEVWVLLLLSVAGAVWVLWSDSAHDRAVNEGDSTSEPKMVETADGEEAPARFAIRERRISREEGHLIVTLRLGNEMALEGPLDLKSPTAKLVTGDGAMVAPFFLPFDPPPVLDAEIGAFADLRYWLPVTQADEALWLEIDGERLPVKDASEAPDFDKTLADRFPEGVEVAVNGLDWQS
ncbi:MAG: hypothetical protein KDN19_05475 [Verrucomicrobiae bacterium]|nr:hypothetical protein [Verrucomicrobiae bacterium]